MYVVCVLDIIITDLYVGTCLICGACVLVIKKNNLNPARLFTGLICCHYTAIAEKLELGKSQKLAPYPHYISAEEIKEIKEINEKHRTMAGTACRLGATKDY